MTAQPKRPGGEKRGNSYDRKARKLWLLSSAAGIIWRGQWAPFGGTGDKVPCFWCGAMLDYASVEADRLVPGDRGGTYARTNIVPACRFDNASRGTATDWQPRADLLLTQPH